MNRKSIPKLRILAFWILQYFLIVSFIIFLLYGFHIIDDIFRDILFFFYGTFGFFTVISLLIIYAHRKISFYIPFKTKAYSILVSIILFSLSVRAVTHIWSEIIGNLGGAIIASALLILFVFYIIIQEKGYFNSYRKIFFVFLGIFTLICFWIFIINFILLPCHIYGFFIYDGSRDIQSTAESLTRNISNDDMKVQELLKWESHNISNVFNKKVTDNFPYLVLFRASNSPSRVMYSRYGVCGDYATLLSEMASAIEIENRRVFDPGENHEWVEVNISGFWKNADASIRPNHVVYNDTEFYERIWTNISRVYYKDPQTGDEIDVTKRYTVTGDLVIHAKDVDESFESFNIIVRSLPSKRDVIRSNTNSNGFFNYTLGDHEYSVIVEGKIRGGITGYRHEETITLKANDTKEIILEPKLKIVPFGWVQRMNTSDWLQLGMLIAMFFVVIVALFGDKFWKWFDRPKINISFDKNSERCFRVAVRPKDVIQDEHLFRDVERYYYRLRIENKGGPANQVKVKIDVLDADGKEKERFEPSTLRWISNRETEDLSKKEIAYVNVCSQVKNYEHVITNRLRIELFDLTPRGIAGDLQLKDYIFKITIYGNNFNPIPKKFRYIKPSHEINAGNLKAIKGRHL